MACLHRFLGKHIINSLLPNWQFEYLFIGTFNPAWNFNAGQSAAYFYGRTRNNYFWDLVPDIWDNRKMRNATPTDWELFLQQKGIGITDIIKGIQDADPDNEQHVTWLKDKSDIGLVRFQNIEWNTPEILSLINNEEIKLKAIFITNQKAPDIIEAQIKIIEQAAIQKDIPFARLITPSGGARFQFVKGTKLYPALLHEWRTKIDPFRTQI